MPLIAYNSRDGFCIDGLVTLVYHFPVWYSVGCRRNPLQPPRGCIQKRDSAFASSVPHLVCGYEGHVRRYALYVTYVSSRDFFLSFFFLLCMQFGRMSMTSRLQWSGRGAQSHRSNTQPGWSYMADEGLPNFRLAVDPFESRRPAPSMSSRLECPTEIPSLRAVLLS